jgi:DNA-binding XRE family transcriptional regulator
MSSPAARLRQARLDADYRTATEAAAALGMSRDTYLQHENGQRDYDDERCVAYARLLGVTPQYLRFGDASGSVVREVKVVGWVGAGDAAHHYDSAQGPFDTVPAPAFATRDTVAAQVRGQSLGRRFDGWLVFYDEVRSPVTSDLMGQLCVVGLIDGRILVKWLKAAKKPGLFHLKSETEATMKDQEVVWAAKVTGMQPR